MKQGEQKPNHKYIRRVSDSKGGFKYVYEESQELKPTMHEKAVEARKYPFQIDLGFKTLAIIDKLKAAGHESYVVGGCVRDALLGKQPKDFDIVTSARPQQIHELFGIPGSVGAKFAVNIVDGHEVATYRIDDEEATSAKETEVSLASSVDEDVRRRDFTVNAMVYDPESKQIFDFVGGMEDAKNRILRFVGDPDKRIRQDPMRMLRAIRFANSKDLNMDLSTFKAIQRNMPLIKKEAPERVSAEMMKMFESRDTIKGLYLMLATGFFKEVIPELYEGFDVEQNKHHAESILMHNILAADAIKKKDPVLKLALLLHDVAKVKTKELDPETQDYHFIGHETVGADMARKIMRRLKFSSDQIEKVDNIIRHHMYYFTDETKDKTIKKFMALPEFRNILRARLADRKANLAKKGIPYSFKKLVRKIRLIQTTKQPVTVKDLAINGHDLMGLGLKAGPLFGKFLSNALELVLEQPEQNQKEILLEFAKREFDLK
jgi:poly(A) polymerase/tRNA nucleotidyltransferase (CCA-adding enzyme)